MNEMSVTYFAFWTCKIKVICMVWMSYSGVEENLVFFFFGGGGGGRGRVIE